MKRSRLNISIKNSVFGIVSYLIISVLTIVSRNFFVKFLGIELLGLNSFFSNIITFLSISEIGFNTAMLFFLYDPIESNDYKSINLIIKAFKKINNFLAFFILGLGLITAPFITNFVNIDIPSGLLKVYFMLYIISTSVGYFGSHYKAMIYSNQDNYIISTIHTICKCIFISLQIIILKNTSNYGLFIAFILFNNVLENICIYVYVKNKYKYIDNKTIETIPHELKHKITKKIKPLFVQYISSFVINSSESIIIATKSVVYVGIYSNYIIIIQMLKTLFSQFFSAFTTSYGNLYVSKDREKCYTVFKNANFFSFCFLTFCVCCFIAIINPFIDIWIGEGFTYSTITIFAIAYNFYVLCMVVPLTSVQNALGLHHLDQKISIMYSLFYVILSFTFLNVFSILGIPLSSIICALIFPTIFKAKAIYENVFNEKPIKFYKKYLSYAISMLIVSLVSYSLSSIINFNNIIVNIVIKLVTSGSICLILIPIIYCKTDEFKYYFGIIKAIHQSKKEKR